MTAEERIAVAVAKIEEFACFDGASHKQWLIDQVLHCLLGEEYGPWVVKYDTYTDEDGHTYEQWDPGIPP